MSLILNIDTATETAQVNFAKDGLPVLSKNNLTQKDHAGFLQVAIQQLIKETGLHLKDINAVAVTAGPGSYTGLRVGMASAKGLCYALNKPLITLNTLEVLTVAAIKKNGNSNSLFCPMIDARRMEVFTAVYDETIKIIESPCALILDENSFSKQLDQNKILFFGNGAAKFGDVCKHINASFINVLIDPEALSSLSYLQFLQQQFTELAYAEPVYLKEFNDSFRG